jgi:hypothetical protein
MERSRIQASARRAFQNCKVKYPSSTGDIRTTTLSFDLINIGNSAATEIEESEGTGAYHRIKGAINATGAIAWLDPAGFNLNDGEGPNGSKHFEIDATDWCGLV